MIHRVAYCGSVPMISEAERATLDRDGLLVLRDIPRAAAVDRMLAIADCLGGPYGDVPEFTRVRPQWGYEPASSGGTGRFLPHTDLSWYAAPPHYVLMYCVNSGEAGSGLCTISPLSAALARLSVEEVEYLKGKEVFFSEPPQPSAHGVFGRLLEQGRARIHPLAIDSACVVSTKFYRGILENERAVDVTSGTLWVVDNYQVCHGRTEIREGAQTGRYFLRLYAG